MLLVSWCGKTLKTFLVECKTISAYSFKNSIIALH